MKDWFDKIKNGDDIVKLHAFLVGVIWVFGTLGGVGYLFYIHKPQFAIAEILISLMALPYVVTQYKKILE